MEMSFSWKASLLGQGMQYKKTGEPVHELSCISRCGDALAPPQRQTSYSGCDADGCDGACGDRSKASCCPNACGCECGDGCGDRYHQWRFPAHWSRRLGTDRGL